MADFKREVLSEPGAREEIDEIKAQILGAQREFVMRRRLKHTKPHEIEGSP